MADKNLETLKGNNRGDGPLHDAIAHWAEVLDRWVNDIDAGLGRINGPGGHSQPSTGEINADPGGEQ